MHATASLPRPTLHRTASERVLLRTTTDAPRFLAARARSQPSDPDVLPERVRYREPERHSRRRSLWGGRFSTVHSPEDALASCLPSLRSSRPTTHVQTLPPDFDGLPPELDAGLPAPPRVRINRLRGPHELDESLVQRQFAQLYTGGRNRPDQAHMNMHMRSDSMHEQDRATTPLRPRVVRLDSANLPKKIVPCKPAPKSDKKHLGMKPTSSSNITSFSNGMRRRRMSQIIRSALTRSGGGSSSASTNSENVPPSQSTPSKSHASQRSMRYSMRNRRMSRKQRSIADTLDSLSEHSVQSRGQAHNRTPLNDFNTNIHTYSEKRCVQSRTPRTVIEDSPKRQRPERYGGQRPQSQSASTLRLAMRERQDSNVPQMLAAAARPPTAPVRRQAAQRLAAERLCAAHMVPRAHSDAAALPGARLMLPRTRSYAGDPTQRDVHGRISMREWSRPLDVDKLAQLAHHDVLCHTPIVPDRNFKPIQRDEPSPADATRTKSLSSFARRARGRVKSALGPMPPTHTPVVKGRWAKRNASQIDQRS